jgi:hypothetical protein
MRGLNEGPGLKFFGGIALALTCLLCLEFRVATAPAGLEARDSALIVLKSQQSQAPEFPPPQPKVSTLHDIILGRPLFDPTRRPPAIQAQDAAASVQIPRLSGIMITSTQKIAVFAPATGAPIIVGQNSRMGAFTVLAIADDSVTMKGPAGVIVLRSDAGSPGQVTMTAAKSTILASGVYLSLIKVALPRTLAWPAPPPVR